jgi:hypothetical protein
MSVSRTILVVASVAIIAVATVVLTRSQRALLVVAKQDITVYDNAEPDKLIGLLRKGDAAKIRRCTDNKSTIEPLIDFGNGKIGRLSSPNIKIEVERTGFFSWPKFPECPGY